MRTQPPAHHLADLEQLGGHHLVALEADHLQILCQTDAEPQPLELHVHLAEGRGAIAPVLGVEEAVEDGVEIALDLLAEDETVRPREAGELRHEVDDEVIRAVHDEDVLGHVGLAPCQRAVGGQ
jgi:hypothetical protein